MCREQSPFSFLSEIELAMIGLAVRDVIENIGLCRNVAKEQDERNQFVISVWQLRSCQDRVYAMDFSTNQHQ